MTRDRRKSEAERYVLAAAASYAAERPCPPPPADDAWVNLAASARVLPMILDHLAESGHEAPQTAGDWRFVGVATHMRALVESRAVASTLDGTGVRWVLVKGPVLAQLIFRRPSIRPYSDLDVLVHPLDLGAAIDALQAAGFELLDRNWRLIADSMRGEISFATPAGTLLDLHWHLLNDAATRESFRLDVRQMVERRTTVDIGGLQVPTLRPADTVVHLAVHAALSGGHRLQWLLDVQQALQWCEIPPGELAAVARQAGALLVLRTVVERAAQYVDSGLAPLVSQLGDRSAWAWAGSVVSRMCPPLGAETGRHTGRLFFASTRSSSAQSTRALARETWTATRDQLPWGDRSVGLSVLRSPEGGPEDRQRWLSGAIHATD